MPVIGSLTRMSLVKDKDRFCHNRDILRLQAKLNEHSLIDRTMAMLEQRLAEIGTKPSRPTLDLAQRLRGNQL